MKQPKYKKIQGVIPLAKGYGLIVPQHSDNKEIMIAIGMLVQIWTLAELENDKNFDADKFKNAMCLC